MRWIALTIWLAVAVVGRADRVELIDGRVFDDAEVLERDERWLVIEIEQDGIRSTLRLPAESVRHVEPSRRLSDETAAALEERRAAAAAEDTGDAYYALGQWCRLEGLDAEATEAFRKAIDLDPTLYREATNALIAMLLDAQQIDEARVLLRELVRRHPDDYEAAIRLGELEQRSDRRVVTLAGLAVQRYRQRRYHESLSTLQRLVRLRDPTLLRRADQVLRARSGRDLAAFMAECRMARRCPACSEELRRGLAFCPVCGGKGTITRHVRKQTGERKMPDGKTVPVFTRVPVEQTCPRCKGFTYVICPACEGVGHDVGQVGKFERTAMATLARHTADIYWRRLRDFAIDENLLHPINAEMVLVETRRLRWLMRLHRTLVDELTPDQGRESDRRDALLAALETAARQVYDARTLEDLSAWDQQQLQRLLINEEIDVSAGAGGGASDARRP